MIGNIVTHTIGGARRIELFAQHEPPRCVSERGVVAIPKSVRKSRIEENFAIFDFELSADDMAAVATLDMKTSSFFDHRDPAMVKRLTAVKLNT